MAAKLVGGGTHPIALIVNCVVKKDRLDEFIKAIKVDAVGSRTEKDCWRFDVLQDATNKCKFVFYEVFRNCEALLVHQKEPHFQPWIDFYKSGGCEGVTIQ